MSKSAEYIEDKMMSLISKKIEILQESLDYAKSLNHDEFEKAFEKLESYILLKKCFEEIVYNSKYI